MQPDVALNPVYRNLSSKIVGNANVLIMPALHAAISTKLMKASEVEKISLC